MKIPKLNKFAAFHLALIFSATASATIAEFYYYHSPGSFIPLSDSRMPIINNRGSTIFANDPKSYFMSNFLIQSPSKYLEIKPSSWSAAKWTGINPTADYPLSQKATGPSYGTSAFQVVGSKVGMHINTWNPRPPTFNDTPSASQQFIRSYDRSGNIYKPWSAVNGASTKVCMNAIIDLHDWYGDNVQAMFGLGFKEYNNPTNFFWVNIMMLDTNSTHVTNDHPGTDVEADTGAPIIFTYLKASGELPTRYSEPISGYAQPLSKYTSKYFKTDNISSPKHYGFCISKAQFINMLVDIHGLDPRFSLAPENYQLTMSMVSEEIAGGGNLGLSLSEMYVYRAVP